MTSTISTQERAFQFHFLGEDRLYTDHDGRRVIVDVEGSGTMHLVIASPEVLSIRWDEPPIRFTPHFSDGALVFAMGPGEVLIQGSNGREAPVEGERKICPGAFYGSGWVVEASAPFQVDGRHEDSPMPGVDLAVPFFREVLCESPFTTIVDSSVQCEQIAGFSIADSEALRARRFTVQNMSPISDLDSEYPDGTKHKAAIACHLNAASFTLSIPVDNHGLIVRKAYDRFHGRQRARVMVDGVFAGWWYEAGENRTQRWHISEFGIDASHTRGKSEIRLTIDPQAGAALWSVSQIEVFALRPSSPLG